MAAAVAEHPRFFPSHHDALSHDDFETASIRSAAPSYCELSVVTSEPYVGRWEGFFAFARDAVLAPDMLELHRQRHVAVYLEMEVVELTPNNSLRRALLPLDRSASRAYSSLLPARQQQQCESHGHWLHSTPNVPAPCCPGPEPFRELDAPAPPNHRPTPDSSGAAQRSPTTRSVPHSDVVNGAHESDAEQRRPKTHEPRCRSRCPPPSLHV